MGCNRINHERDFVGAASKQKRVLPRARPQHSSYQLSPHQRNSSQLLIQCQNSSTAAFHIARALRPTKAELTPQKMKRMCKQMRSFMFFCLNIKKKEDSENTGAILNTSKITLVVICPEFLVLQFWR